MNDVKIHSRASRPCIPAVVTFISVKPVMQIVQPAPREIIDYTPGRVDDVLDFLKRARYNFRTLRFVRVWPDRLQAFDVNGDSFLVRGLGYPLPDVVPVLDAINAVYRPDKVHDSCDSPYKEFKTGRRYPWAADRVM
jgi:hypothetical protein